MHSTNTPRCRFCGASLHLTFVDLGSTPLANSYVDPARATATDPTYPLHARVCESCFLVQVESVVPAAEIFGDYAYFSSFSDSWLDHARRYAHQATKERRLDGASLVLEIASNDGYLLRHFAELGIPTLGIEPARNVAEAAAELGIETIVEFFGTSLAEQLASSGRRADLVVANNVLAHVPDLNDFVEGMRIVLEPGGAVSIEVPHILRLIEQVAFDTIYHEHYSYFSLFTIERVLAAHELVVFDVEELSTHGGSLRVWATHRSDAPPASARLEHVRTAERAAGIATTAAYDSFTASVARCRDAFVAFLADAETTGRSVAAYGAAAKGNTFLNYCGVTADDIEYVVDRSPHKQGLLLPGSRLPIHSPEHVAETRPDFLVILPWNLRDEIAAQMGAIRGWDGRFVVAVPSVETF
jgi:2-polyprenyl-3-methyl-5-hydroxy-6-metoxy-1,4-benzoquinol methylase